MAFRPSFITQATLYKFRYILGYTLLFAVLLVVMTVDLNTLPNGICLKGMNTVVASMNMSLSDPLGLVINAPYHALQYLSVTIFGLERLSIVLPSIIFGAATMILFFLTMRQWFRESVAVVTTLTAVTTAPFITMLRGTTPDIMLPFWTIVLLYAAVKVLIKQQKAFVWKLIAVIAALGLLYTPFGVYTLLAFIIGGLLHPHVRSRLRRIKTYRKIILIAVACIGLVPLIIHLVQHPENIAVLTGVNVFQASLADMRATLDVFYRSYINFTDNGFIGTSIVPAFNIASVCLMVLGLFRTIKDRHTTRSYVMLSWLLITTPVMLFAPGAQHVILVPALLLLTIGSETLIVDWYKLFPRNPYARIAGLIPLTILFVTIAVTNITHYFYNHQYIATPANRESLSYIRNVLDTNDKARPTLLVTDVQTLQFYRLLEREYSNLSVTETAPSVVTKTTLVTPEATAALGTPSEIHTSSRKENSVTLRIYEP